MTNEELAALLLQRLDNRENDYNESIKAMNFKLDKIQEQTTKTNGRVTILEIHEKECPIKDVQKNTEIFAFFVTHPKIFYFCVALIATLIGFNFIDIVTTLIK
jgi:ABC-type lipoprotein release transport system permease subunit